MNIAFVTNFCSHYRVKTFELLGKAHNVEYFFYSEGDEWYWQKQHGVNGGEFVSHYLPGFRVGKTRVTPALIRALLGNHYDVYIKCINGKFALPITFLASRMARKPFILWTGIWMRLQTRSHRCIFPLTKLIYRHADAIVVYGEHVKRYLQSEGIPAERIFVTTHAVDNARYDQPVSSEDQKRLRHALRIPEEQKVVLFLGRFEPIKGLPYLIEAFASLDRQDACLVLAGEGTQRKAIEDQVTRLGIAGRVRFAGYVSPQETLPFYAMSCMLALPSITTPQGKETWGLVINEAFNQGLPVIATDAVGAAAGGLVEDGINGFVVPERDSQALSAAIQKLLNNPDLRRQMGSQAKAKIAHWDNAQMVAAFCQAIDYVTQSHPLTH